MKIFFKLFLIIIFFVNIAFSLEKDTEILSKISAKPLFELDESMLDKVLRPYVEEKKNILAVRIVDLSYDEVYWEFSRVDETFEKACLSSIASESTSISIESKMIGRVDVCYFKNSSSDILDKVEYSEVEKQWLEKNPIIKLAKMDYWPTDIFAKNIHVDYVNLLSQYGQLNISLVDFSKWNDGFEEASKGDKVHGILNLSWSKEREANHFDYTKAYFYTPMYILVKKDEKNIKNIEDLKDQYVLSKKGSITNQIINQINIGIKPIILDTELDMKKELSKNNTNAKALITYVLDKDLLESYDLKIAKKFFTKYGEVHIGTSKNNPILKSILNKAKDKIPVNKLKTIQTKNYKINSEYSKLTLNEKEWIKNKKVIKFAGNPEKLPFEGFNSKDEYIGIVSEYLKKFEQEIGIKIEIIQTNTWLETLGLSKTNSIDIISADMNNSILRKNYLPIQSFMNSQIVVVMDKNSPYVEDIRVLKNKKIGVIKGYGYLNKLYKKYPNFEFIELENSYEALNFLDSKKIDAVVGSAALMSHSIKNYELHNLSVVGFIDLKMESTLYVKNDEIVLFNILSKFISSIEELEHSKIKNKYIDLNFETIVDYTLIWYLISIFLVLFLIAIYYNRRLQILVEQKTYELKDLNKNLEEKVLLRTKQLEEEKDHVHELNEDLKEAKEEAENLSKQKSEFLANMSHEIRTPMNSVIGFTEILEKEINNPVHKEYLNSIKKGGDALLRIINDILDLSKIEAGKLEIKKESINPRNIFIEMESIFHTRIISKNINFSMEIDQQLPKYIITDGVRVRQILFNLIGNAIKFTDKGDIKLKAQSLYKDKIKSKVDLVFIVEDSGIGIDKENLRSIFNAFEQQKNQNVAKYGGTGLGLSICAKLAKMLNGKIEVESKLGFGSTFKVTLFDLAVSSINEETKIKKVDTKSIVFEKARILVVDDVKENRKLVIAALKGFNFDIVEACNGKEAIDILNNINFDLILMDLRMPVMDGYEAASIIKGDEKLKDIPLVALTASVMGKDFEKVTEYGFDGYLRKPVILDDLLFELTKSIKYQRDEVLQDDNEKEEVFDLEKVKKLIIILEENLKEEYLQIKDSGDFSLIEEFCDKVLNLSKEYKVNSLKVYCEELKTNIESFDIEKVDYLLNTYEGQIEKIKEKSNV